MSPLVVVALCAVAAGLVGLVAPPPGTSSARATVTVWPLAPKEAKRARVPKVRPHREGAARFTPAVAPGAAYVSATGSTPADALGAALAPARRYMGAVNRRVPGRNAARPAYAVLYTPARAASSDGGGPLRSGLLGVAVGLFALLCGWPARRLALVAGRFTVAVPRASRPLQWLPPAAALLLAALAALIASTGPAGAYPALLLLLVFASAFLAALSGERAVRAALLTVIVLAPLRGALLGVLGELHAPSALLLANGVQPALIAGAALGVLARGGREALARVPRAALIAWAAILAAVVASFATQSVGVRLYGIGVAQYMAYPTAALVALAVARAGDVRRVARLVAAMGVVVALSIFLEAGGVVHFVEAASPYATGTARYGGSTGSYLHASIFLGCTVPLLLGFLLDVRSTRDSLVVIGALLAVLAGIGLTYGRGGMLIAAIAWVVMFVAARGSQRGRLLVVALVSALLAAGGLALSGSGPGKLAARAASAADWGGDPGNVRRFADIKRAVQRFADASLPQKALGQGPAATGNAEKLLGDTTPRAAESYPIKVLVELGVLGLLLIGGVLAWAVGTFVRVLRSARRDATALALGAAGIALAADSLLFQTLEVQLIALVWWLLVAGALRTEPAGRSAAPRGLSMRGLLAARPRARSSILTAGGNLGGALGAVAAAIVAARVLGRSEFAAFGVGLAAHSLALQLADLGLSVVTVAETAGDWSSGRGREARAKLLALGRYRAISATLVLGGLVALAELVPPLAAYSTAIAVGAGGAVFGALSLFFVSALQGGQRFGPAAVSLAGVGWARLAFVAVAAAAGLGSTAMLAGYAIAAPLLGVVLGWLLLRRELGHGARIRGAGRAPGFDARRRRAMLVASVASAAVLNGDVLLLAVLASHAEVAQYAAAWRIAAGVALLNAALASSLLPHIMLADDPAADVRRMSVRGVAYACALLAVAPLIAVVGLAALGGAGKGAGAPLVVLLVAFALDGFVFMVFQHYIRVGRAAFAASIVTCEVVLMAGVTVALSSHGAIAPAVGQLAARVFAVAAFGLPIALMAAGRLGWFDRAGGPPSGAPARRQPSPAQRPERLAATGAARAGHADD